MKQLFNYIDNLNSEDRSVAKRILDYNNYVTNNYAIKDTDFFNPKEILVAQSIFNYIHDTSYIITGISKEAERRIMILYPIDYKVKIIEDDYLSVLKIAIKTHEITHRDVLGSLLSIGINRNKIGDIFVKQGIIKIIVKREISEYVLMNFDQIGKQNISLSVDNIKENYKLEYDYKKNEIIVSSLRIDNVVSSISNISRSKAVSLINAKFVKLNWDENLGKNEMLKIGDIFSIKGFGKYKFSKILRSTKKENLVIEILEYI